MAHADGDDRLWNAERVELHGLITERSPTLAGMYRLAVVLIGSPAPVGEERARLSAVGHCLRELMNNLPDALRDVEGMPAGGGNSSRETKTLVEAYEQFRGGVSEPPREDEHSQEPDLVTVPRSFVESVGRLHSSYRQGERRAAQRDSAAVLGRMDPSDPAVRTWRAARDFFMDLTHLDRNYGSGSPSQDPPSDLEVLARLEIVEATLKGRLGPFFETLHSIDDLLEKANAPRTGDEL